MSFCAMPNANRIHLGVHNLSTVSTFVKSSSGLGLMGHNNSQITGFLNTAAGVGGLAAGKVTSDVISKTTSAGIAAGFISTKASQSQVAALLNSAIDLGVHPKNVASQVDTIMNVAKMNGVMPTNQGTGVLSSAGIAVAHHKLKFKPFEMADILEVSLSQGINEHATLYVKGILKPGIETVQDTNSNQAAALFSVDEQGTVETLFKGIITKVSQNQATDLKYFEAEAISPSYTLDIMKNSRSFQKKTAKYRDIIDQVSHGAAELKMEVEDKTVNKLIVQYRETDWQFLKRMASHFNTGLVPVCTSDSNQIFFGVPSLGNSPKDIQVAAYSVQKSLEQYSKVTANDLTHSKPNVANADFTVYQVKSYERLNIGDAVNFLNHTLYVKQLKGVLEQGVLKFTYFLTSKQGMVQKDLFNDNQIGVSLMGQVKVITKDQVKVHITEIDPQWDDSNDWYFPYATLFSSPDGSGWYAMPEPGDTVRVHFPNHREEEAVASSSVNRDESAHSQAQTATAGPSESEAPRTDPDKKCLSNKDGKQVVLTPDGIYIINEAGATFINLTDAEGITIVSSKDVTVTASENILIKADKELLISAGEKLTIQGNTSSILMDTDNVIKIEGNQVKTN